MTPAMLVDQAQREGVALMLSAQDTIRATGERDIVNRWVPVIRDNKPAIVGYLKAIPDPVSATDPIIGYSPADLAELDSLVNRLCDLVGYPESVRQKFHAIRKAMAPATVTAELAYFRKAVTQAEKHLLEGQRRAST